MPSTISSIFFSIAAISSISVLGVLVFSLHHGITQRWLMHFVSLSAGTLLGTVFLHIIPELVEHENISMSMMFVLAGIVGSFILEKAIHWRHCHDVDCHEHAHPVGIINVIGDAVHNFVDGMLIAGSFLVSPELGIAATIAVAFHEIPQEIGDFAILLHSGYSRKRALLMNLLAACTAFIGAAVVLLGSTNVEQLGHYLLPIAAGNFLYIAGVDLLPELHKESRLRQGITHLFFLIVGIVLMVGLTSAMPHMHAETDDEYHEEHDLDDGHMEEEHDTESDTDADHE